MKESLYNRLIKSLNENERKDYEAICRIIDNKWLLLECSKKFMIAEINIALISQDPYLSFLIFIALTRIHGIKIHIINPLEGQVETSRLVSNIDPYCIITTEKQIEWSRDILIDGETISKQTLTNKDIDSHDHNFSIVTYSPYPTKIHQTSSEAFEIMLESLIHDLKGYNLIKYPEKGCIPILSNNIDYLLYYIALKVTFVNWGKNRSLPSKNDVMFPVNNKKSYMKNNSFETLFIPKKELIKLWEDKITSLFERKCIFNLSLKNQWIINLLIKRRLKKLFSGFSKLVIIGTIENTYMMEMLSHLSFIRVHIILPSRSSLFYGTMLTTAESIIPVNNNYKKEDFKRKESWEHNSLYSLNTYLISEGGGDCMFSDKNSRFQLRVKNIKEYGTLSEYFYLGNINNSFENNGVIVFPETLEKIINSYSFIKECALLKFNQKVVLIVNSHREILDSNKINWGTFKGIISSLVDVLNKELPETYKIKGFTIDDTTLIERDRNGDIVRWSYNRLNEL